MKCLLLADSLAKIEAAHTDLANRFFASNAASQMLCTEVKQDFIERDDHIDALYDINKAHAARIEKLEAWMKTVCDREVAQQSMNDETDQTRALCARVTGTPIRDLA